MSLRDTIQEIFDHYGVRTCRHTRKGITFQCPFHPLPSDGKNNAIIYVDKGFFKCFNGMCGVKGFLNRFVGKIENCSNEKAKAILKKRFGFDFDELVFQDDDYWEASKVYYALPKTYTEINPKNPYLKEHGFLYETLFKLSVGEDSEKPREFILPYTFQGDVVGYATKPWDSGVVYPLDFPVNDFLYGFDQANMFPEVYVVEGQRDVWRLFQFGFPVVGLNNTECSNKQLNLLIDNWDKIIICMDGDKPGRIGAKKLWKKLRYLVETRIILLPEGLDPEQIKSREEFLKFTRHKALKE